MIHWAVIADNEHPFVYISDRSPWPYIVITAYGFELKLSDKVTINTFPTLEAAKAAAEVIAA